LAEKTRLKVEAATIRLAQLGGRGVLVPSGLVITAAHCIKWDGRGGMVLGDYYLEPVATRDDRRFRLSPWFADPVADIAALGEPDNQEFVADCDAFEEWREAVEPVPLSDVRLKGFTEGPGGGWVEPKPLPVHVLTHDRGWVEGTVTRYGSADFEPHPGMAALEVAVPIIAGASGSPVVDGLGRLVGVISSGVQRDHVRVPGPAGIPIAHMALPRWIMERIEWQET
jgi:hypothetical protein